MDLDKQVTIYSYNNTRSQYKKYIWSTGYKIELQYVM